MKETERVEKQATPLRRLGAAPVDFETTEHQPLQHIHRHREAERRKD